MDMNFPLADSQAAINARTFKNAFDKSGCKTALPLTREPPPTNRRSNTPPSSSCAVQEKKRILMLISDTGGGHRASAQAMESMMEQLAPGACDVRIVDVFTDYCPWPFNKFVPGYAAMAKNPWMWQSSWHGAHIDS